MEKAFHVLYADETCLNSLDSQIHGRVSVTLHEDESFTTTNHKTGELGLPGTLKGEAGASESSSSTQSTDYVYRDFRYFDVLQQLSVDLYTPKRKLDIECDGELYSFSGKLCISSLNAGGSLVETIRAFTECIKDNPTFWGLKNNKELRNNISGMTSITKIFRTLPVPPAFLLELEDGKKIFGPIIEPAIRMGLQEQAMIFGSTLPFKWTVAGYLYPIETEPDCTPDGFLFTMMEAMANMREYINPKADAITRLLK